MQTYISRLVRRSHCGGAVLAAVVLVGGSTLVVAEEIQLLRNGPSVWLTGPQTLGQVTDSGAALLRPPESWSWNMPSPKVDFAAGLEQRFASGLSFTAGVSVAQSAEFTPLNVNYRDYFLGVRYGSLDSKVGYLPETDAESSALYYDAGWQRAVHEHLSVSVRVGQFTSADTLGEYADTRPSLSIGASSSMAGYGLGLRLIDGGGQLFGGDQDVRLMGSISRPLK